MTPKREFPAYAKDVAAWAKAQAQALRDRDVAQLDWENLADEILDVAKAEKRELGRRVSALMASLAKNNLPNSVTGPAEARLVQEQRKLVMLQLADTPSLHGCLVDADWLSCCWSDAIISMAAEGLPLEAFPEVNPWSAATLLPK